MRKSHVVFAAGVLVALVARGEARSPSRTLIPQFDNPSVKVWKTILAPHQRLGMHRHDHGRVVVALKGGTLTIPHENGTSRQLVMETGKAYWLDADPVGELHGDHNESGKAIEMMVIEVQ